MGPKARAKWLKHGDHNTNFFHQFASACRRKNMIKGLVDDQGEKHEDLGKMKEMVREFYTNMFTSEVQEVDQGMIKALMPDVGLGS